MYVKLQAWRKGLIYDMKILITGGAGFIGSNLVEKLLADNQIYVVDNLSTGTYENLKEFENNENLNFIIWILPIIKLLVL